MEVNGVDGGNGFSMILESLPSCNPIVFHICISIHIRYRRHCLTRTLLELPWSPNTSKARRNVHPDGPVLKDHLLAALATSATSIQSKRKWQRWQTSTSTDFVSSQERHFIIVTSLLHGKASKGCKRMVQRCGEKALGPCSSESWYVWVAYIRYASLRSEWSCSHGLLHDFTIIRSQRRKIFHLVIFHFIVVTAGCLQCSVECWQHTLVQSNKKTAVQ